MNSVFQDFFGGESGIRTLDTLTGIHDFQSCALDHLGELSKNNSVFSLRFQRALNHCN
jgi:hypothetical protein